MTRPVFLLWLYRLLRWALPSCYDPETSLYGKLKPALYRDLLMLLANAFLYQARQQGVVRRRGWRFLPRPRKDNPEQGNPVR